MKKILIVMTALFVTVGALRADWISKAKTLATAQLEPLAGDLGGALGGGECMSPSKTAACSDLMSV